MIGSSSTEPPFCRASRKAARAAIAKTVARLKDRSLSDQERGQVARRLDELEVRREAARRRERGLTPGLWYMPYAATSYDPYYADKPQLFAMKDGKPSSDAVAAAFKGIEFTGPAGHVKMALGEGHQGITGTAYGTYKWNAQTRQPEIVDVIRFDAECVNPPAKVDSTAWLEGGMKGAKCK